MIRALIFANGELKEKPHPFPTPQAGDLVIAADGGAHHCQVLGIQPDIIIGDFDSLRKDELSSFRQAGVTLFQYPTNKDETDLELAFHHALKMGAGEMIVYGALGARWDMTLANLLLLGQSLFNGVRIRLLDERQEITIIRSRETMDIHGKPGDIVSLIPLGGDSNGITTQGLEYPLNNENLIFGSPRGVSNLLLGKKAQVSLTDGLLLCVILR